MQYFNKCDIDFLQLFKLQFIFLDFFFIIVSTYKHYKNYIWARDQTFMQSWHTFFWAARFVISWLENFKAIVWSDQKFFDSPDKKHAMACKVCKNWAFQRNLLSSAHTHTKKNPKREWFAIWFLGAELSSLALYPKINANQHFRSTPSQNRFYIFGGRERMKHSGVC